MCCNIEKYSKFPESPTVGLYQKATKDSFKVLTSKKYAIEFSHQWQSGNSACMRRNYPYASLQISKLGNTWYFLPLALNSWVIISKRVSICTLPYLILLADVILSSCCSVDSNCGKDFESTISMVRFQSPLLKVAWSEHLYWHKWTALLNGRERCS